MIKNTAKARHIINVICGLLVVCFVCTGAVYDASGIDVTITEIDEFAGEEKSFNVRTRHTNAGEIIDENSLDIGLYDKSNVSESDTLESGDEIVISRGVRISVLVDGAIVVSSTTKPTVGEALTENGVFLGEQDYTVPPCDSAITDGVEISIVRVSDSLEVKEERIPFETIYKDDSSIYVGETKVESEGREGVVLITESVVTENGAEVSRNEVSREIATEKKDKVIAKGTKKKVAAKVAPKAATKAEVKTKEETPVASKTATKSSTDFSYSKKLSMTATAYSAFSKNGGRGKTASGMTAGFGVAAVDPKVIPLGTKLYIEGYGYAVAADTGGAIKGNKIDLCFDESNSTLMAFGRKTVTVYIIK